MSTEHEPRNFFTKDFEKEPTREKNRSKPELQPTPGWELVDESNYLQAKYYDKYNRHRTSDIEFDNEGKTGSIEVTLDINQDDTKIEIFPKNIKYYEKKTSYQTRSGAYISRLNVAVTDSEYISSIKVTGLRPGMLPEEAIYKLGEDHDHLEKFDNPVWGKQVFNSIEIKNHFMELANILDGEASVRLENMVHQISNHFLERYE
ncbi:MAG TPA: hypothetical protein VKC54_02555 [Patescibacteria group bacterium]|nr:hypothetical protein [Patescibacteria group bacterium]